MTKPAEMAGYCGENNKAPRFYLGALNPAERTEFSVYCSTYLFKLDIPHLQIVIYFVNITKYIRIYFVFTKSVRKFVRKFRGTTSAYIRFVWCKDIKKY